MSTEEKTTGVTDAISDAKVHLLDIGSGDAHRYGDCLLCQFGDVSVLIDGGHPSDEELVMGQLRTLLGQPATVTVSLIIITHPHDDHIGCLPGLVAQGKLKANWALVCDPQYRWGNEGDTDSNFADVDPRVRGIVEAALEHDRTDWDDDEIAGFVDSAGSLETRYRRMLEQLRIDQTRVVLHGTDAPAEAELLKAFASVGLEVLGPSLEHLKECFRLLTGGQTDAIRSFDFTSDLDLSSAANVANAYRNLVIGVTDAPSGSRGAINLESLVTCFTYNKQRFIFAGDMQFADPQVSSQMLRDGVTEMRQRIRARAPYAFVKLSHHGSFNGFDTKTMPDYGNSTLFGISCGDAPGDHPNPSVLALLDNNRDIVDWVRSDRNGLVSITFNAGGPTLKLTRGKKDDATPPNPPDSDVFTDFAPPPTGAGAPVSVDGGSDFTFTAKVPANATRLSVTLDLQPGNAQSATASPVAVSATADFAESIDEVHEAGDVQDELTPNSADDVESEPGSAEFLTIDADCNVPWRAAKSLLKLRDQVNTKAPRRNKASDGTIGDTAHCQRNSDHNPWVKDGSIGVVTAMDITNDPAKGCDANTIAEAIRASRDSRVKYIIWNRRIANSAAIGSAEAWQWRPYTGENPHTRHVHISVKPDKASYDSTATWSI
ncbi:MAG TPA: MBL fold metallo-hydrolase [Pyrinomonadaceae bacterium]|nr:MBL fold metallo-hydrolase [Pyrinomonadaceae bacterium]